MRLRAGRRGRAPCRLADCDRYRAWVEAGFAGEMRYLTDHRAAMRDDPRALLPAARSVICVGKLYNTPRPYSTQFDDAELAWISRYAWGDDYHRVLRRGLGRLEARLRERAGAAFESKICVDTAPLLERTYARLAGLGWIGKNTCLINQPRGSWFFLGELLVSLEIEPDAPPPDRCGTCRRCIDACPTAAIVPFGGHYAVDSRLCISYFTIELRGGIPEERRAGNGGHVFGCDICQDVCPWNRRAPVHRATRPFIRAISRRRSERLAAIGEDGIPRDVSPARPSGAPATPVSCATWPSPWATARLPQFRAPLERLAAIGRPDSGRTRALGAGAAGAGAAGNEPG